MIIERLDLIAFGRFAGESLDLSAGPVRFHVVYGPNESGKSTSLRAIHSLLFGMQHRSDDDFLHGYKKMRVGGRLRDAATDQVVECVRKRGQRKTLLSPDEKAEIEPSLISAMLRGVDGSTFSRRFGLTHQELVAGGRAIVDGGGDLGELLFAAGAGAAALRSVKQQLEKDRGELFVSRGTSRSLNKLIAKYQELTKELRSLRLLPSAYDAKHREREQAAKDAHALDQRRKEQSLQLQRMKAYANALPLVAERESLLQRVAEISATTPLLDEAFSERRRDLEDQRLVAGQQHDTRVAQLDELRRRHEEIRLDDAWLQAAPTIKSLMNELGQIQSDEKQLEEDQGLIDDANRRIDELIDRLGRNTAGDTAVAASDALPLFTGEAPLGQTSQRIDQRLDRLAISDPRRVEIEKLAGESGGLLERLDAAGETVASLQRLLAAASAELAEFPRPADPAPLSEALAVIGGNPHKLLEASAKAADEAQKAERRVREALSALPGFAGDLQQLSRLVLPAAAQIDQHAEELEQAKDSLRRARADLAAEQKRLEESQTRLRSERSDVEVPTAETLEQARCGRDRELDVLRRYAATGEPAPAAAVEALSQAVRRVDRISDQMHLAHDQVVRRKQLIEELTHAQQQVQQALAAQGDAQAFLDAANRRWTSLWQAIGVAAGDPAAMRKWCADRAAVLDRAAEWEEKTEALAMAEQDIRRHAEHLLVALRATAEAGSIDSEPTDAEGLLALHLLASRRRDDLQDRQRRFAELENTRRRRADELTAASEELAKYQRRLQRWQTRWSELTQPLADAEQVRPEEINAIIRIVDECHRLRRQRDAASEKLARSRRRRDDYLSRVRSIATELAFNFSDAEYAAAVCELARAAEEQEKRQTQRSVLAGEITTLEAELAAASQAKQTAAAKLRRLCAEARCNDVADLPAIEQASQQRRQWENELHRIERQLRAWAESGSLEAFIAQASQHRCEELKLEIEQAEAALEKLKEEWGQKQWRLGQLEQEIAAMDGSDRAARVQQEQQNLLAAIRRQANDYARLTIAQDALRRAIEHYREHNEGPVLARASAFFSRLTGGEYASLQVDFDDGDQPRLYGVRPHGEPADRAGGGAAEVAERSAARPPDATAAAKVLAGCMSDGTADALYLALRLASLEVHLDTHQPIPLIVDDCLIQFDDARTAAALQIFSELATRTQVILFTHHQHLIELAGEHLPPGGFHLHRLDKTLG